MKALIAVLSLGFLLSPALVMADDATAQTGTPPQPSSSMRQAMEQAHAQMQQMNLQARQQMLASLTPAHRAALANIVGQLAISPNPNYEVAAQQIDRLLTQSEGQAILRTHTSLRTQQRAMMEQMRAQFEASLTPEQQAQMQARRSAMEANRGAMGQASPQDLAARTPDPGRILLETAVGRGEGRGGFMMHGGPGPGGPPPGA
jgi:hypothetical protein